MERKWVEKEKLSDFLLILIGSIIEQYQQYHFLAAELDQYNSCLEIAARKTENDIASDKHSLWTWPDRANLNLYKITWVKGGYYDSSAAREAFFHYESGWSLSDRPDDDGYFHLLTPTNSFSFRKLKVTPTSIELFSIARVEDVPAEIMVDICHEYEVAVASELSIPETQWTEERILNYKRVLKDCDLDDLEAAIHMVFPEHLPKNLSSEFPDLVVLRNKLIDLGKVPCLEVRLAVEAIAKNIA